MLVEFLVGILSLVFVFITITALRARDAKLKTRGIIIAVFGFLSVYNIFSSTLQMFYVACILMIAFSSMMILRANDVAWADRCYEKLKHWWKIAPYRMEGKNKYGLYPLPKQSSSTHGAVERDGRMYLPDGTPLIPIDENKNPVNGDHDGNTRIFRAGDFD